MKTLTIVLLILLAALQYRLWAGHGSLPEVWRLEQIRDGQREENKRLGERNQSLAAEVIDLKEGMEAVEERARSEMGMIAQGETFYQIIEVPHEPAGGQLSP
ncbi:MAG: cell division protein FtsB [Gammaproteobacteria bacterium]|nr:cell division protein FtsB [Gammaproteobacteria bacterium]